MPRRHHRRRDRGFSLLVVFMLMIVMVGIAATVILSSQQDLNVAGQDREQLQAFYAAEYAIAQAKDYLEGLPANVLNAQNFVATGGWTAVLQTVNAAGVPQGCLSGPSTPPVTPRMAWQDFNKAGGAALPFTVPVGAAGAPRVMWRYCIHNNAEDIAYADTASNHLACPSGCGGLAADSCDCRDPLNYITIEAWGAFPIDPTTGAPTQGAAIAHLAVNLGPPTSRTQLPLSNGYSQEGASGSHNNNGGSLDSTAIDTSAAPVVK